MSAATVKARIEPKLKAESEIILRQIGLDMTGAIKMFLSQVVMQRGLPFEVKVVQPNAVTLQAIEDSYSGKTERFDSVDAMLADADR
jgi:DNA-damage-inducible protein J